MNLAQSPSQNNYHGFCACVEGGGRFYEMSEYTQRIIIFHAFSKNVKTSFLIASMVVGDLILLRADVRKLLTGYWKLSSFKNVPAILLDTVLSKGKVVPVLD
jgi:hypothetical protein